MEINGKKLNLSELNNKGIVRAKFPGEYNENNLMTWWKQFANEHIKELTISESNRKAWINLIRWSFARDTCEYDLNKSIGLIGPTGTGKTVTMKILNQFIEAGNIFYFRDSNKVNMKFHSFQAREMADGFAINGHESIYKYTNLANLCIDDLGVENTKIKYYGSELNVIEQIIELRYAADLMTHFTSNLNKDDILQVYGDRVWSRLNHSCNIIELNDIDYRLNK